MKVFVAGASGAVGRPLVRRLSERGHEVVGMTRSSAGLVRDLGATPVVADALDATRVRHAIGEAAPDVVVNELTDLARPLNPRKYDEWLEGTNRLRRDATRNLADAAASAGVKKFVSQSIAFAYTTDRGVKTEESSLVDASSSPMAAAVAELERITLGSPGGIVLRYGFFYGPGTGYALDGQQIELVAKRRMPIVGGGAGAYPFIHVDDAAAATVAAIERGAPGVYNVVDDEPAPAREWIPYVAELVGAKRPIHIPTSIAKHIAGPLVGFATALQPVSNEKAKRELVWTLRYPSWRDGFRAELA